MMKLRQSQQRFVLPPTMRQIIVVRHGSAAGHAQGMATMAGVHSDPELTEDGLLQAEAVAAHLQSADIAALYTSALQRTRQTALPLARATKLQPIVIPGLNEVHLGDWEHGLFEMRMATADPICMDVFAQERWDLVPGAETKENFGRRVALGFAEVIAGTEPGYSAVAVLHAAVIAELCHQTTGSRSFAFIAVENGSITRFLIGADGKVSLRSFNETQHLA